MTQIYLHLVIISFKLRSLLMATLKTVLSALCSYQKKHLVQSEKQIILSFQRDSF